MERNQRVLIFTTAVVTSVEQHSSQLCVSVCVCSWLSEFNHFVKDQKSEINQYLSLES